jgi:hypothetical protein
VFTPPCEKKSNRVETDKRRRQHHANPPDVIRTKGRDTNVIQIHDLIVTNFRVLCLSGDNELMASRDRNLQEEVKTQKRKENRRSDWGKYLEGRERNGTNIYAVSHQTSPDLWSFLLCRHFNKLRYGEVCVKRNGTNRIEGDGNGTSSGVSCRANGPVRVSPSGRRTGSKKKEVPAVILRVLSITLWWYS